MTKNNARHKQAEMRNTNFQNKSPLMFMSLPIKAFDNVVIVM